MLKLFIFCAIFFFLEESQCLNNGLARTPPMGWMSWQRFRCNVNCKEDPDECISEKLFMRTADAMAAEGYRDAGYEYVIIDDCWMAKERDEDGNLQPDPVRFPHGIKWLANYIHSKNLKFGIYGDFGTFTCGGYPGSEYHLQQDAQMMAEWGVDYYKMDGCYADIKQFDDGYPAMGFYLNKTGRPIVYSCSWPAYQEGSMVPDYKKIAKNCNLWRNYGDIDDSWQSVKSIIGFYGDDKTKFSKVAGPGNFNDPDMLVIGNFGLSEEQERVQMALWSLMAAPLLMSTDLDHIRATSKQLLLNKHAIAINQDPSGVQGRRVAKMGVIEIWVKPLGVRGRSAFGIVNFGTSTPSRVSVKLSDLGATTGRTYRIYEVFSNTQIGATYKRDDIFKVKVNPSGVFFGKLV